MMRPDSVKFSCAPQSPRECVGHVPVASASMSMFSLGDCYWPHSSSSVGVASVLVLEMKV